MIYKVIHTYSYRMGAIVEADSEEEAIKIVESNPYVPDSLTTASGPKRMAATMLCA